MTEPWRIFPDVKPEEGQNVLVVVEAWSLTTDGKGNNTLRENGKTTHKSWFTENPYPSEHGMFLNGFAFNDNAFPYTLHKPPEIRYWLPIPPTP